VFIRNHSETVGDVDELKQRLIEIRSAIEQNVINRAIDQW